MTSGLNSKKNRTHASSRRPPIEKGRWAAKGTKPLPDPSTMSQIITIVAVHICKKVLFVATEVKITLYSIGLFFGSVIFDFLPVPRIYLANRENFINLYFVKFGWGWTVLIVGCFVYLTSTTYSCGHKEIIKRHMSRIAIATLFWLVWVQAIFVYIERTTGVCLGKAIVKDSETCWQSGYQWHSFDISGHSFLLVYINLVLVEEAKAIIGWESIKDLLRMEEHNRGEELKNRWNALDEDSQRSPISQIQTSLSSLSLQDLSTLKDNYSAWTPSIRILLFLMTVISLLSDIMLAATVMYFHTMPQKVAGGMIAMATWYFTYRFWFKYDGSPGLPGIGLFKYAGMGEGEKMKENHRRSSITKNPCTENTFMGMPIYKPKGGDFKTTGEEQDRTSTGDDSDFLCEQHRNFSPRDFFSREQRNRPKK